MKRPFSPGFITARIIYPILLGIIFLSTVQLPPNTVSAMAAMARNPQTTATTAITKIAGNIDVSSSKRGVGPDLNWFYPIFCSWEPGGAKPPGTIRDPIIEKTPSRMASSKAGANQEKPETASNHPKVAIIIDDVGYTAPGTEEMVKLPLPLTWAILPDTPYGRDYLALAKEKQVEVMLHLPLEPEDGSINPGPGVIKGSWDEDRIISQLDHDLAAVPGVVGVNNHMGSLGTQDRHLMALLMKTLHQKKLFFVDSRTTANTVAEEYAGKYGALFARRRVFIDNDPDIERKKAALRSLITLARKEGSAIGIAHIRNGNAAAITSLLPEFAAAGIEFVPVSQLVRQLGCLQKDF
ncbi:MAG TPA: divergent polysaccharide deacetylase family protein [Bacillota bacterium]|nr:divergent polysaccharide deacetylase family protein [Bacillota bacterium]